MAQPNYPPTPSSYPTGSQSSPNDQQPVSQSGYPPAPAPAPAPRPSHLAISNPMPVLGPQYCLPNLVDLAIVRKVMTLTSNFDIMDANQNLIFKLEGKFMSLHGKRVLRDGAGNPLLTLRHRNRTMHDRWQAFRGDSEDPKDLLFTTKRSTVWQMKTELNVYLANSTSEDVCDFRIEGSWSERACAIYVGQTRTIAAQMHKKGSLKGYFLGKDTFMVTVYPNADYAFIIGLIIILDYVNGPYNDY